METNATNEVSNFTNSLNQLIAKLITDNISNQINNNTNLYLTQSTSNTQQITSKVATHKKEKKSKTTSEKIENEEDLELTLLKIKKLTQFISMR
jgi:hypothetical protein